MTATVVVAYSVRMLSRIRYTYVIYSLLCIFVANFCFILVSNFVIVCFFFFFQAEDGIRDLVRSRGLGDVYKRQAYSCEYDR